MLKSLYKYSPSRPEFFENFLLRGSTPISLNDPFEALPSIGYFISIKKEIAKKRGLPFVEEDVRKELLNHHHAGNVREKSGLGNLLTYGIISLTECPDNLLMWSHYADNHRGFVLAFDITHPFFSKDYLPMEADFSFQHGVLGRVNRVLYNKKRLNKCNTLSSLDMPYLHKSDEWMYEKEHRLVLPLYKASCRLIHKDHCGSLSYQTVHWGGSLYEIHIGCFKSCKLSDELNDLINNPNVMFMYKVPPEAIKGIIFGSRVSEADQSRINEIIGKTPKLKHIYIKKASLNPSYYQVDIPE